MSAVECAVDREHAAAKSHISGCRDEMHAGGTRACAEADGRNCCGRCGAKDDGGGIRDGGDCRSNRYARAIDDLAGNEIGRGGQT